MKLYIIRLFGQISYLENNEIKYFSTEFPGNWHFCRNLFYLLNKCFCIKLARCSNRFLGIYLWHLYIPFPFTANMLLNFTLYSEVTKFSIWEFLEKKSYIISKAFLHFCCYIYNLKLKEILLISYFKRSQSKTHLLLFFFN